MDDGTTPLYIAAQNGHEAIVRVLIELGADVKKAEDDGWTPLYVAAYEGNAVVVRDTTRRACGRDEQGERLKINRVVTQLVIL
jgi:ankyrin repeat protein